MITKQNLGYLSLGAIGMLLLGMIGASSYDCFQQSKLTELQEVCRDYAGDFGRLKIYSESEKTFECDYKDFSFSEVNVEILKQHLLKNKLESLEARLDKHTDIIRGLMGRK